MRWKTSLLSIAICTFTQAAEPAANRPQTESQDTPAVAAIKKLGGYVTYDETNPVRPAIGVDLTNSQVTDDGWSI